MNDKWKICFVQYDDNRRVIDSGVYPREYVYYSGAWRAARRRYGALPNYGYVITQSNAADALAELVSERQKG